MPDALKEAARATFDVVANDGPVLRGEQAQRFLEIIRAQDQVLANRVAIGFAAPSQVTYDNKKALESLAFTRPVVEAAGIQFDKYDGQMQCEDHPSKNTLMIAFDTLTKDQNKEKPGEVLNATGVAHPKGPAAFSRAAGEDRPASNPGTDWADWV